MTLDPTKAHSAATEFRPGRRTLAWAGSRLALGTAQITGATAGLILLLRTGASKATFITVAITGGFTLVSRLLFHGRPGLGRSGK